MKQTTFIVILIAMDIAILQAQSFSWFESIDQQLLRGKYEAAKQQMDSMEKVLRFANPVDSSSLATLWHTQGRYYYEMGDYNACLEAAQKALAVRKGRPDSADLALTHHLLGLACTDLGLYFEAIKHHEEALSIRKNMPMDWRNHIGFSWHELGRVYAQLRDFPPAFNYFQKALDTISNTALSKVPMKDYEKLLVPGAYASMLMKIFNNIGSLYNASEAFDLAVLHYKRILPQYRNSTNNAPMAFAVLVNLGGAYLQNGQIDSAKNTFKEALQLHDKVPKSLLPPIYVQGFYQSMGRSMETTGDLTQAKAYYLKAAKYGKSKLGANHITVVKAYRSLCNFFQRNNDIDSVRYYLALASQSMDTTALAKQLYFEEYFQVAAIFCHTAIWDYECSGNLSRLQYVDSICAVYEQEYQSMATHRTAMQSKFSLRGIMTTIFDQALTSQWLQYRHNKDQKHLEMAFRWIEKAKSINLLEATRSSTALQNTSLPDSLLQQEIFLRSIISEQETQVYSVLLNQSQKAGQNLNFSTEKTQKIISNALRLREKYITLLEQLKKDYPRYAEQSQEIEPLSLNSTRNLLKPDETLLSYFWGSHHLFVFALNRDTVVLEPVEHGLEVINSIQNIQTCFELHNYSDNKFLKIFSDASTALYQKLIAPVSKHLSTKLVILPHRYLYYLPFEVLLEQPPKDYSHPADSGYLICKKSIRYCFSAGLLAKIEETRKNRTLRHPYSFAGFAPFANSQKIGGTHLPESGREVNTIGKIMESDQVFIAPKASTQVFKKVVKLSKSVLLTTHAEADLYSGEYSYLHFLRDTLYLRELYSMDLSTDLIVLDACQSGVGRLEYGDSSISLNWGCARAGASSVITNLWDTDDKASTEIMIAFFKEWKKGSISKSEALSKAKRQYLVKNGHPFFWGTSVLFGDDSPYSQ